ncbi:hypothetical protein GGX14DRAFT_577402 [Mycena pura]|uniref:Uncharacterized protein n=1 Tax=Mycena pura TaxID=153505 RepID=A0AAD6URG7_9AGAR|nr:hypothetical protein GGX14DRAFT_577402 [Mycena pura]
MLYDAAEFGDERDLISKMPGHHSFPWFQRRSALCDAQQRLTVTMRLASRESGALRHSFTGATSIALVAYGAQTRPPFRACHTPHPFLDPCSLARTRSASTPGAGNPKTQARTVTAAARIRSMRYACLGL